MYIDSSEPIMLINQGCDHCPMEVGADDLH